nr:GTP pyrophosphokinase family protein [Beutenbergia cavernae]
MARTPEIPPDVIESFRRVREDFTRFMLSYRFGMEEVTTKLEILREEFAQLHSYNPIEHVSTRLKSPESVVDKATRRGVEPSLDGIRSSITDIAGVRVTCSFVSDAYRVFDALVDQPDVVVRTVKDYIAEPKPNGYRSLHAIVEIPVFLSSGPVHVPVEVQFRTVAMDFWATLEHKIFYKFDGAVPPEVVAQLRESASTAARLDEEMERLHDAVHGPREPTAPGAADAAVSDEVVRRMLRLLGGADASEA